MATASARTPSAPASPSARPQTVAQVLARGRVRGSVRLLGPAFVAAVAYVDPGNFATNVAGGARYGYLLLWVIVAANATAMLVQYLSSKLGLVTGLSLPEACRARYPAPIRWLLWAQAELVAIATDVAEFLGAAIAIHLLTGASPLVGGLVTAVVAIALLGLRNRGFRAFEVAIAAFLLVVVLTFGALAVTVRVDAGALAAGLVPRLADDRSVLLAIGILGATVMPHVVYLHSALVTDRVRPADAAELRSLLRFTRLDVMLAMCIAGAANAAMLVVAAATFHGTGAASVETLDDAHAAVGALIGPAAAVGFAIALLASGISSSSVGTMAGQVVMQGFVGRRIPLWFRRAVTMLPALAVLADGLEPSLVLVLSQAVLSFGIPFALVPLVHLTSSTRVMGEWVNRRWLTATATTASVAIVGANGYLLALTLGGA